ncbi:hypothetical protein C4D60_Mb03t19660 [Musa balbisiana]|uniref:Uncharacterized protein n=1 Tax=Musa balbisiana TaxID=52838 RepID=A0A4S8JC67_MUSBA|nr:hypothetical protein C4D60_Mb03t19660 [Musa balbisiana]
MGMAAKTIRRSFHAFFRSYQAFASAAALLVFPASAATLLAQSLDLSSPVLRTISSRLAFLFDAAGLPPSRFFSVLKTSVYRIVCGDPRRNAACVLHLYPRIARTSVFNSLFVLSANAAVLSLLFLAFNVVEMLHLSSSNSTLALSASGVILYAFVLSNAVVTCNLSIVISVTDGSGGHLSILKALVLVKGRTATAITLTLPASLGMAAIEALFQHRVTQPYRVAGTLHASVIWEAFSIIYMHSLLLVLDTIITCTFLESCQSGIRSSWRKSDDAVDMASEPKFSLLFETK